MKNRSLLIIAISIFFSLFNWQCSSNKQVEPQLGLSGMYNVSKFISGDSTFNNPRAYIATTQLSRDQIQIFFALNQNGKESSIDFANFNIEPINDGSYAILRGSNRVGVIDQRTFSLNLDANSPSRFYIEAQK
jgi:hypothetical protein